MAKYGPKMAQMAKMLVPGPCGPHSGHFLKIFLLKMDFSWSYTYTVIIAKHLDDYFYVLRAINKVVKSSKIKFPRLPDAFLPKFYRESLFSYP